MNDKKAHVPAVAPRSSPEAAPGAAWAEIKRNVWNDVESRYNAGDRDKETVCGWMAYRAALVVCKGWPQGSFDELVAEGYEYAVSRWSDYDPTKATKNGISGFLYKAALGRMRNAAKELFTAHGKRKHRHNDVIPNLSVVADVEPHIARDRRSPVTKAASTHDTGDYFTNKADVGGINDKAVTAAARKSGRTKLNWTTQVKAPGGGDRNASRLARIATEIHVHRLLALLPNSEDRKIIECAWGIDGVKEATVGELAERAGCSESTMYNRINKLLIELKFISMRPASRPANELRALPKAA